MTHNGTNTATLATKALENVFSTYWNGIGLWGEHWFMGTWSRQDGACVVNEGNGRRVLPMKRGSRRSRAPQGSSAYFQFLLPIATLICGYFHFVGDVSLAFDLSWNAMSVYCSPEASDAAQDQRRAQFHFMGSNPNLDERHASGA